MARQASIGRLRHRVGGAIQAHRLWEPGHRVVVAVSGGLDSVCLLDVLVQTAGWHGADLAVATVDHGLHPESADHARFVEELARGLGLPCFVRRVHVPDPSEASARTARYAALEGLEADRVALAHHREDQAETVLLQLLRGAGARGLGAMARRRGRYVRPLLDVHRAELEAWARHRGLRWVEDPTNPDPRYLRNRVRHEILPLLEELRAGAVANLARSAALCAEDDAWLEGQVPEGELERAWVAEGPAPLVARALRRRWPEADAAHLAAVVQAARRGAGQVRLPGGRRVVVTGERIVTHADGTRIIAGPPVAEEDNPEG